MNKFISFLKRRGVQMMPVLIVCISIGILYSNNSLMSDKYCRDGCTAAILDSLQILLLSFLPGAISLVFVRWWVVASWSLFALPYIYIYQPFFFLIKVSGHRLVLEYELVMELNLASVSPRSPSSG